MPTLRKRLRRPETYLFLLFSLVAAAALDSCRKPATQVSARLYVGAVHLYQAVGRPLLKGHVRCRYRPTCSDYSIGAVQRHGIGHGLVMTIERVSSCNRRVPLNKVDDVPPTR